MNADLLRESGNQLSVIEVDIKDTGISVQRTDALDIVKFRPDRESGMVRNMLVRGQFREPDDPGG